MSGASNVPPDPPRTETDDPEELLRENRDRLERLATSDLPIAEDAQRALDRLESGR